MRQTAGPVMTIACGVAAIIGLGLGGSTPRWVMFTWPAIVVLWSLVVLSAWRTNQVNRKTIESQRITIRNQADIIGQILATYNDGRE